MDGGGLASLVCRASAVRTHLACFESKQGENSRAIERERSPFLPGSQGGGIYKAMDAGVESTSNTHKLHEISVNSSYSNQSISCRK